MTSKELKGRLNTDGSVLDSFVNVTSYSVLDQPQQYDFQELHAAVNENAERFWGVNLRSSDGHMEHGDGIPQRLLVLKKIIKVVPEEDLQERGIDTKLLDTPASKLVKLAERNQKLVIRDPLSEKERKPTLHKYFPSAPKTYLDAHQDQLLKHLAANTLRHSGDYSYEIVRTLEGWRYVVETEILQFKLDLGRLAFKNFMFSIGSENYMKSLATVASWQNRIDQNSL